MEFFAKTVPSALTFLYLPDEPYPPQYPQVRQLAENVRSNPGPGGRLPTFVTKRIIPELEGAIDIWCVPPQAYDIAKADEQRKKGRRVWFYNGGRPQGPTLLIDAPATDARVVAWAAFKHDVDVYFFWHGVHWRHNRQKQGERQPERVGRPDHLRQSRPAAEAHRRPGLPERGRRPDVPGRGEGPSRGGSRARGPLLDGAAREPSPRACRTTST